MLNCEGPVRMRALWRGDAEEVARGPILVVSYSRVEVFGPVSRVRDKHEKALGQRDEAF